MNHFFAVLSPQSPVPEQVKCVQNYFHDISQSEIFSITENGFYASCLGHKSWKNSQLESYQRNQLTFIGSVRLDNEEELLLAFPGANFKSQEELILALFEKHQEKSFEKLMGDFSFLIWDSENQAVFCVKDQIGVRPMFYYQYKDSVVFSSSIAAIRAFVGKGKLSINELYVAKELKNYPVEVEETFFQEIHRLKPAHFAHIKSTELQVIEKRYWEFQVMDTSAFVNKKAVYDELRRLFQQAVKTRLRRVKIAATQLSGGLDSSAITVLASRILPKENLHTFSFVLNETTREFSERGIDEQATQNSIIEYAHLLRENHHLSDRFYYQDTLECYDKSDQIMGGFADSDSIWQDSMYKQASEYGVELIFSGFPGDEGISNSGGRYFFEYLHQLDLAWMWKQWLQNPYVFAKQVYQYFTARFSKSTLKGYDEIQKSRDLLHPDSLFHSQLTDSSFGFISSFREELISKVFRAHSCLRTESEGLYASQYGIVTAYPMADLRFVQFALSLPMEYFKPVTFSRPVFRTICEGILPDDVRLQQKRNGAMTLAFAEYWKKTQLEDFKDWEIKNSLGLLHAEKAFDDSDFNQANRHVVMNKLDYLIEKNHQGHEK
ncbi:asparagine synthase-related protein [Aquirufa sp. ROCK2-A2]